MTSRWRRRRLRVVVGGFTCRQVAEEHPESAVAWRLVRRRRTPAGLLRTGPATLLASGDGGPSGVGRLAVLRPSGVGRVAVRGLRGRGRPRVSGVPTPAAISHGTRLGGGGYGGFPGSAPQPAAPAAPPPAHSAGVTVKAEPCSVRGKDLNGKKRREGAVSAPTDAQLRLL